MVLENGSQNQSGWGIAERPSLASGGYEADERERSFDYAQDLLPQTIPHPFGKERQKDGPPGVVGGSELMGDFASARFADRMTEEHADVAQLVEQLIRNQ